MDDAERIPIDLGYEVVVLNEEAVAPGFAGSAREDGTIILDILVRQPCGTATNAEIIVCAVAEDGAGYLPGTPPVPVSSTATDRIGDAMNIKLGPVELGSIKKGDGSRALGARVRF